MTKEECVKKLKERLKKARNNQNVDYGFYYGVEIGILQSLELIGMLVPGVFNEQLEDEIDRFEEWNNSFDQTDYPTSYRIRDIARHFYELGLNARKK